MDNNNMMNGEQNPYTQQDSYTQQDPYAQQPVYTQQPTYQQPTYQQAPTQAEVEEPVSVKEWLVTMLLLLIPCANIVLLFVWAFSNSEKKSKSNYFKAYLIFTAIMIVASILISVVFSAAILAAVGSFAY